MSSLAALEVDIVTTSNTASDEKFAEMIFLFQCFCHHDVCNYDQDTSSYF